MSKIKTPKHRCSFCGEPSARPYHPGCQERSTRREKKPVATPPEQEFEVGAELCKCGCSIDDHMHESDDMVVTYCCGDGCKCEQYEFEKFAHEKVGSS